jgi:coenzyme PQQ precursor peptide PqqA
MKGTTMNWITPDFEEISLNCEINCYSSAEI